MNDLPLQNIRIVDHTIAWAGPQGTQVLADMGAEVIKVEACNRPDIMRGGARLSDADKFWERGTWWIQLNRNKLAITVDLNKDQGKELYLKLVAVSDVVIDNFTPRVMPNLGLDYDELVKAKSDIIVLHQPGYGSSGPYRDAPAFGDTINAFTGLDDLTGYPGGRALRPGIPFGDPTSGFAAAFAVLAAVHHRNRTGKGQLIDVSHFEIVSKAMSGLLDHAMNGRVEECRGNRDASMAPQGCYPCRGDDRWVAITIADDREWKEFGRALGDLEWTRDSRFATVSGRRQHHDELDELIASYTSSRDGYELMRLLQESGIAAAPVLYPGELPTENHFVERGFFEESTHPYAGTYLLPGMLYKMSDTPGSIRTPAPLFGEHNRYVYEELLGLSADEVEQLTKDGIIGTEPLYSEG